MARTCSACGAELSDEAVFCRSCGAKTGPVAAPAPVAAAAEIACPRCGTANPAGARFCKGCGATFGPGGTAYGGNLGSAGPKRNPALWIALGIGLALIAAAGGYLVWYYLFDGGKTGMTPVSLASGGNATQASGARPSAFSSTELLLARDSQRLFLANLQPEASPANMHAEAQEFCRKYSDQVCAIAMVRNDAIFPRSDFNRQSEDRKVYFIENMLKNGNISAGYKRGINGDWENLFIDCAVYSIPSTIPNIECVSKRVEAPVEATTEAEAAPYADASAAAGNGDSYYVVADANLRSRPTGQSPVAGGMKLRNVMLQGRLVLGEDGESYWLQLADGSGYVSEVNLARTARPQLRNTWNDRYKLRVDRDLYGEPSLQSPIKQNLPAGSNLYVVGFTGNGFAEVKLALGGVGYVPASASDFNR